MSQLCWEAGEKEARLKPMEGWSWTEGVELAVGMEWVGQMKGESCCCLGIGHE